MSAKSNTQTKFKVGDRVRYYGAFNEYVDVAKATVVEVCENGILGVKTDEEFLYVHPNQCRRLKPKKKPLRVEGASVEQAVLSDHTHASFHGLIAAGLLGKKVRITMVVIDE